MTVRSVSRNMTKGGCPWNQAREITKYIILLPLTAQHTCIRDETQNPNP